MNTPTDLSTFVLEDSDVKIVNSLRRTVIAEVSTLAIDEVNFYCNTSILDDEMLAHRMGLIVLDSSEIDINQPNNHRFALKVKCTTFERMDITADMIKFENPEIRVVNPKSIIVFLRVGEFISVDGITRVGKGKEHAKWKPTAGIEYNVTRISDTKVITTMTIESVGSLSAAVIMDRAITIISENDEKMYARLKRQVVRVN